MSEIANGIIMGLFCEQCGEYMDDLAPGCPRSCESCSPYVIRYLVEKDGVIEKHDHITLPGCIQRFKTLTQTKLIIDTLDRMGRYNGKGFLIKRIKERG